MARLKKGAPTNSPSVAVDPDVEPEYKLTFNYQPSQKKLFRNVSRKGGVYLELCAPQCLEVGGQRSGKGFSPNTKIVTPHGHLRMGDIRVGSTISNPEGSVSRVIGVYPRGLQQFYRITFRDGDIIECDADHIWPYFTRQRQRSGKRELPYVLGTTEQLWERFYNGSKVHRIKIPTTKPLEFCSDHFLKVDPYTIGVLIGDGGLSQGDVAYTSDDPEIAEKIPEDTFKRSTKFMWGIRGIRKQVRELGLLGKRAENKFIPKNYLWSSCASRWKLLQGLMDTDGTCEKLGHLSYCTVSPKLAQDFKFLVQSLGGIATLGEPQDKFYRSVDGDKIYGQPAFVIYVSFPDDAPVFSLKRKQVRRTAKRPRGFMPQDLWRTITNIERLDLKESICIKVDHPNGLFLVDNCIVTHNTTSKLVYGIENYCLKYRHCDMMVLRRTISELKSGVIEDFFKFFPKDSGWYTYNHTDRVATFRNGSRLVFAGCENNLEKDIEKYLGQAYPFILVDECGQFSDYAWNLLYARNIINVQCEPDERGNFPTPYIVGCTNPTGPFWTYYHTLFVKQEPWERSEGMKRAKDGRWFVEEAGQLRCVYDPANYAYNHSTVLDNAEYIKRQPNIVAKLNALPEALRKKFLLGYMDTVEGPYFDCFNEEYHVIDLRTDPEAIKWQDWQPVWVGHDWGVGHWSAAYFFTKAMVKIILPNGTEDWRLKTVCFAEVAPESTGYSNVEMADMLDAKAYYPRLPESHPDYSRISGQRCKVSAIYFSHEKFSRVMEKHSPADEYSRLMRDRKLPSVSRCTTDRIGSASYMYNELKLGRLVILKSCSGIIMAIPALQRDKERLDDVKKVDNKADDRYDAFRYGLYGGFGGRKTPQTEKDKAYSDSLTGMARHFYLRKAAFAAKDAGKPFKPAEEPIWMSKL